MPHLTQPAAAIAATQGKRKVGRIAGLVLAATLMLPGLAIAQDVGTEVPAATPIETPAAPATAPAIDANTPPAATPAPAPATSAPAEMAPAANDSAPAASAPDAAPAASAPAANAPAAATPVDGAPVNVEPAAPTAPAAAPAAAAPAEPASTTDMLTQLLTPPRSDLPHNLSPWGMFMAADWVVKSVMIGLALASLITWTIWLSKSVEIACARARIRRALAAIQSSSSLAEASRVLSGRGGPAAFMVRSAEDELRQSAIALSYA
ncbi:hypothetical protein ACFPP9_23885, partial [Kaistia terrae]